MAELPLLTAELPGIGGRLKVHPEDFQVEEIPLYPPSGRGTHTYLWIEKTGLSTERAIELIADALGLRRRDVGYAGLKDARAITRQMLSAEHVDPNRVAALSIPGVTVLRTERHTNKLKLGHLKGNRFSIKVRQADVFSIERVEAVLEVLVRRGVPNYFGPQRFGLRGDNGRVGLAAVKGDYDEALAVMAGRPADDDRGDILAARGHFDAGNYQAAARAWPHPFNDRRQACRAMARFNGSARRAWRSLRWQWRRMFLSAMQSELFNRVVARRLDTLDRVLEGDLAMKHANGAVFRVNDPAAEQPRADDFEISPTGPLVGRRMTEPQNVPADLEAEVLAKVGLSRAMLVNESGERIDGARRALRVRPEDAEATVGQDDHGQFVQLCFSLSSGSYATVLMGEVCKGGED